MCRDDLDAALMPNKIDDECEQAWQELQRNLASISQQGKLIIAERSGHRIMLDRPDVVISAIRGVVEAARFVSSNSSQAGTRRHPAWEIPPRRTHSAGVQLARSSLGEKGPALAFEFIPTEPLQLEAYAPAHSSAS
jgi:hypothetical protein